MLRVRISTLRLSGSTSRPALNSVNAFVCSVSSLGLEPTNFYKAAINPTDPRFIYGGAADIKGVASDDGGESWRVLDPRGQAARNSIYGFAFDPALPSRVYIATAKWHDWPNEWYANPLNVSAGIWHVVCKPPHWCINCGLQLTGSGICI